MEHKNHTLQLPFKLLDRMVCVSAKTGGIVKGEHDVSLCWLLKHFFLCLVYLLSVSVRQVIVFLWEILNLNVSFLSYKTKKKMAKAIAQSASGNGSMEAADYLETVASPRSGIINATSETIYKRWGLKYYEKYSLRFLLPQYIYNHILMLSQLTNLKVLLCYYIKWEIS